MAKLGRPFAYQEGDQRPVTISLRVPADVYDRLKQYSSMHGASSSSSMHAEMADQSCCSNFPYSNSQGTGNANFYFATGIAYACLQVSL